MYRNTQTHLLGITVAAAISAPAAIAQQYCNPNIRATTPTERFIIDTKKDTVLDTQTGLMWRRCDEGLTGPDCAAGTALRITWGAALRHATSSTHAGYKDWRLPNLKELHSLLEYRCVNPAINTSVFPNANGVWASTPRKQDAYPAIYAWYVDLFGGNSSYSYRDNTLWVRLVRGGQ